MKFKGQAFETMMLVISVIVAIAILGALLGILGGVGGGFGSDSKDAIKDAIKKIEQRGVGVETKDKVDFNQGSVLPEELVVGTSVSVSQLHIYCVPSDSILCSGDNAPVKIGSPDNSYDVSKKASGTIVVAKGAASTNYHICVGNKEALTTIVSECKNKATSG